MEVSIRAVALLSAVVATIFQIVAEAHAAPATVATAPWLDGRPAVIYVALSPAWRPGPGGPVHLVRYDAGDGPRFGVLDGDAILQVADDVFSAPTPTGRIVRTSEVRLLSPLSAEQVGTVTLLERPQDGFGFASTELALLHGSPLGRDDPIDLRHGESCSVQSVLVLVAAGRTRLLGVTGGTLIREGRVARACLALGPSLVQDSDLERTHGLASEAVTEAARVLSDGGRRAGDLVVVPLPGSGAELGPGTHAWVAAAEGVGELRNSVWIGPGAGST